MTAPRQGISRRWFLGSVVAAAAGITVTTAGQTVPWLSGTNVLGARDPGAGKGLAAIPVNRPAAAARIERVGADYRLKVTGAVTRPLSLSLDELTEASSHDADLPLTCVEGWSVGARWTGVRLRDLLERAGATPDARVRMHSLEERGRYRTSELDSSHAWSDSTVLATAVNGVTLDLDHGYPIRLLAPNRPGVLQTKWLGEVEVL